MNWVWCHCGINGIEGGNLNFIIFLRTSFFDRWGCCCFNLCTSLSKHECFVTFNSWIACHIWYIKSKDGGYNVKTENNVDIICFKYSNKPPILSYAPHPSRNRNGNNAFSSGMFNVGLVHMPSFRINNLSVLKGLSLLRIVNFPISKASSKLWGILKCMSKNNDKFWMNSSISILEKGLSPILVFASISSTIEENKTHNPWVGFGFSILVMYFCISGFEDKFWCKRFWGPN